MDPVGIYPVILKILGLQIASHFSRKSSMKIPGGPKLALPGYHRVVNGAGLFL